MAVTINASTSSGLVQTADTSGTIELQNNGTTRLTVGSSGVTIPTLNTATGVLATQNGMTGIAKAWVQFNASSGTAVLNGSFNISSITVNATGDYTINFTTTMANINYDVNVNNSPQYASTNTWPAQLFSESTGATEVAPTTSAFRFYIKNTGNVAFNPKYVCVSVFSS